MAHGEHVVRQRRRKRSAASRMEKIFMRILPFALFLLVVAATWYVYDFLAR